MDTREQAATRKTGQHAASGIRNIGVRHIAFIAFIAAIAVVTTTVVMIGGSAPAHACLLPGIPC